VIAAACTSPAVTHVGVGYDHAVEAGALPLSDIYWPVPSPRNVLWAKRVRI
jgi:hypothetical protein